MSATLFARGVELAERGLVPEALLRAAIRAECERHARRLGAVAPADAERALRAFVDAARAAPIALVPEIANEQHYEVPAEFFAHVLGPHRKYSACVWPDGAGTLAAAEAASLGVTCERAALADGQRVLELGCGWGSLSLWMAATYPRSSIVAVSNSASQRAFITGEARRRGLGNLEVLTADMNAFEPPGTFDRVVSVEMFEHMRNWEALLGRIAGALAPDGRVFLHVFCHRAAAYAYEPRDEHDWLARHFFSGGMMPSADYLHRLSLPALRVETEWTWSGTHYARTADAWARNLVARRADVLPVLAATYGAADAERWFGRWRIFFLACAEMFALRGGREWLVRHARLARR